MSSPLLRLTSLATGRPRRTTAAVLLTILALLAGALAAGGGFTDDFSVPGIESQRAQDLLDDRFPAQAGTQATVVFTARDGTLRHADLDGALHAIERQPHVVAVDDPRTSEDRRTAYAAVSYDAPAEDLDAGPRERLEDATASLPGVDVALSGEVVDGASTGGFPIGEVVGLAIAALLLFLVLRSLRAAANALLAAFAGLGLGFALLLWASTVTEVPGLAPTLAGMLGLGAGIDYALLVAARQQEELRAGHAPPEAARRANASAGHAALTAAGIVLVSIAGLIVTGIPFVGRAGLAAGIVVLAAAITCVVLLPARFAAIGRRVLPRRERRHAPEATGPARPRLHPAAAHRAPRRLHAHVANRAARRPWATRRPWLALVAGIAVTAALAAPAAGLELGQPDDRNLGPETTQRQAYDRLAAGFGAGVNGPLVVAVALPGGPAPLGGLADRLRADREVAAVAAPVVNPEGDAAVITVTPRHGPQDERTRALVDRLRADAIPAALAGTGARPTSAAGPRATATRRTGSRRASRCSPPPSSASRWCSCWRRSAPGACRSCRRCSTSPRSPPRTA